MAAGKFHINIDPKITERDFIEHCLNLKYSGYEYVHILVFWALGKQWHNNKLFYYLGLLNNEEVKNGRN